MPTRPLAAVMVADADPVTVAQLTRLPVNRCRRGFTTGVGVLEQADRTGATVLRRVRRASR